MSSFVGSRHYKKLVYLVPPLFLSGCLLDRDPYIERDWAPKIDIDSRSHLLSYKTGKSSLTNQDKTTLKRLYREFDHLDQIMVRIGIDHFPTFARSTKNKSRVDGIRRYLLGLGINSSQIQVVDKKLIRGSDIDSERPGIIVSFQKSTIVIPKCPGWNYRMDGNVPPEGEPDFGCNTSRNTAIMAADPNVLIHAEEFGGSDGARSALSVQELRTDKVKKLKVEQIKNQSGN